MFIASWNPYAGIVSSILKELKCYLITGITSVVGFFSSKSASSHFCDSGKHCAKSSSFTCVRRSEMKRHEMHCQDRGGEEPKSLSLSVSSLGFIREGNSSPQTMPQICEHNLSILGSFAAWAHGHLGHGPSSIFPGWDGCERAALEKKLPDCVGLPFLGNHFYAQPLDAHLSYVAGTSLPSLIPSKFWA